MESDQIFGGFEKKVVLVALRKKLFFVIVRMVSHK
jgi:hypothetical protein